ncbi:MULTISPECIES: YqiA/YcfP family alpha/beta fold hydrolase [Moorena]|uniref:Putative esterase n=1 Tax=Moorena producens 3L TaxID=489825 RepID=F4XKF8_9CYAN|nr:MULTISPECIES: YqiA/YcfP family alpha/beta fold hydrolase [Moorena]NEQ15453.1 alpha/beta fold hydrolase [Moorena sp. SIO3E2]NES84763.1 alpha/beta fold hydrolase [Moorena sp. SIO2B7]EGJ35117.1 putative esterase [Moorena producens 3L]NEP64569.1 alpha/beta fold hydrolase [Moorena sp. SIO3A5]NES42598.1 alpha/beta fold hydrolase [Moorena sp. SIO2C4]
MKFIYLHGFASSPESAKAVYLQQGFASLNVFLTIPDLNQDDFNHLTISRQISQVAALLPLDGTPVTLIGSSLGAFTAAHLAQNNPQIKRLVLLAPAFGFLGHWLPKLEAEQLYQWRNEGYLDIYHYREKCSLPLHYQFVEDARNYEGLELGRQVPTLILHGCDDEVIPIMASRDYASTRPWVQLVELESDAPLEPLREHGLRDVMALIWAAVREFCDI